MKSANWKLVASIIGIVVITIGVLVTIILARRNQDIRRGAAPATQLTLNSSNTNPGVGQTFNAVVNINTGGNQVIGAELDINFDENLLTANSISPGGFFSDPEQITPEIDNQNGNIHYSLFIAPGGSPASGNGQLAVISFTTKTSGTANIQITPQTLIGAVGEGGQNALLNTPSLNITIGSGGSSGATPPPANPNLACSVVTFSIATPTPSPTPSPTPTATPTLTPSPTATATPSPFARCVEVKIYDTNWIQILASELPTLSAGDTIRIAVAGTTNTADFDRAIITINGSSYETTTRRAGTGEFYIEYSIPSGTYNFNIGAIVHHTTLGWF